MRIFREQGYQLNYPDEIGFAFNPCLLVQSGSDVVTSLDVSMTDGEKTQRMVMQTFGNEVYADVREYVQGFFDSMSFGDLSYFSMTKSERGKKISFTVDMMNGEDVKKVVTFDVFYIWGALKIGGQETYNGYKTLTWYRGFPFSFSLYCKGGGAILFSKDGVADRYINVDSQGVYDIPMLEEDDGKMYYLIHDCSGAFQEVTFDKTFDMTFRYIGGGIQTEKVRINIVDGDDNGYYLRWIDRHGFYCYYLFKKGDESRKTTSDSVFMRNNLLAYDMSYGYQGYTGRQQQMSREDTIPVCAPLVDSETFDMLMDMVTSPCVDLFAGYDSNKTPRWIAVTINAGTYKKTKAVLQDFVTNIVMPEVQIQKL